VAKKLTPEEREECRQEALRLKDDFGYLVKPPELVPYGVAYHHADLEVGVRNRIAELFEKRILKVVVATTTLGAGVNMPARFVVVRDVFRTRKLLPVSVVINMLGRAGRAPYDRKGDGYFLVDRDKASRKNYSEFIDKVLKREVEPIESQIPINSTNISNFILSTAARMKGVTRDELATIYNTTLAGMREPLEVPLPSKAVLQANIGKLVLLPKKKTQVDERTLKISAGVVQINGGGGGYLITMSERRSTCGCWAWRTNPREDCKHIQQLKFEAINGKLGERHSEARIIATTAFKEEGLSQRPMYMISTGIDMLTEFGFLAEKEGKLHITNDGRQALVNYLLNMEHVRMLRDTIRKSPVAKDEEDVIKWAINNFGVPRILADEEGEEDEEEDEEETVDEGRLDRDIEEALWKAIENVPYKQVVNQSTVVRFLEARETLEQIFGAYLAFTPTENKKLSELIRVARNRVHYGCTKSLLPLMILDLEAIRDPVVALKLVNRGITRVQEVATMDPEVLTGFAGLGPDACRRSIEQAKSIVRLISEFSGLRTDLNRLAAQTGVKIDDIFDYLLPLPLVENLRK